jgi:NAD(P)-dependent dehydrogenase (short-subunit alcohol dehydrogenase family)
MDIRGHTAIVTGAASGLGEATARMLVTAGARLALADIDGERIEPFAAAIGALACVFDVASAEAAEAAVARVADELGAPRLLVNCAGIAPAAPIVGRAGPMPLDAFERAIRVNLVGTFNLMRLAAARMSTLTPLADGERGVIVNTTSIAAFEAQIGQAAYAASKGGIASLTLPAARELAGLGIRVVAIAPGPFRTPMLTGMPEPIQASLAACTSFPRRFGRPEEYAALVAHIVSNPMLNGEVIRLDGAVRMPPR